MNFISGIIIGLIIGGVGAWVLIRNKNQAKEIQPKEIETLKNFNPVVEIRKENLKKLETFIVGKDHITNDEVEKLFNVSDATAERYLQELEHAGKLKQIGAEGMKVYYEVLT